MTRIAAAILLALSCAPACTTDQTGLDGGLVEGADGGAPPVWVPEPGVPTREDLFAVWGRSRDDIFAVGWAGTIVHWNGIAWTLEASTSSVTLADIHGFVIPPADPMGAPTGPIFAVGWGGTVIARNDDGTWVDAQIRDTRNMITSTLTQDLFGIFVGAEDNAVAVGESGKVLGWNGTTWRTIRFRVPGEFTGLPIEPLGVLKGIWSPDGDTYFVSGSGGAAYRSNGGFMGFTALDTRVSAPLRGVWGARGGPVYTVGLDGLILRYDGEWRRVQNNGAGELPRAFLFDIDGVSPDDITIVGWRGTIVRYQGGAWFVEPTGTDRDLRSVWIDRETGVAFAVGATGTVLRRDPPPPPDAGPAD